MQPTRRAAVVGAAALGLAGAAATPARRIVSLNPCLDAILLAVAAPRQIAALSHYSREPGNSSIGDLARQFPFTYESAEEVIALSPDLVLASRHSSLATRNALKRLGVKVEVFSTPDNVPDSLAQVRRVADLAGQPGLGRREIARIEAALTAAAPAPGARPVRALVFQRNGFSSGPDTLMDELLRRTGFRNAALDYGAKRTTDLSLDVVVADPPDILLSGEALPGAPTWGERVMRHPALERLKGRVQIVSFPQHLMFCGGPNLVEAAERLAKARRLVA
ncbi:ABC transporter substrate-binding protein [Phenylobacterium sp. LjRoot219]|uniref:ABC transporter substrate-binding protein n=1 Tax=Phenylobacterium sp. LjRoot219 TaxID=3342283 RepID=UPI003ECE7464